MNFVIGNRYILDEKYNNSSEIVLLRQGSLFCTVQSPEADTTWDVMKNRLSFIDKENKNE